MAPPKAGPLPPADLASRELPLETIAAGARLIRIHRSDLDPLFFGSAGGNRFDDPARAYGVCYLTTTPEGAFAETCLRDTGARLVALSFLEARSFTEIVTTGRLNVVSLHSPGLAQIGATNAITSGPHSIAQQWSKAIHSHPVAPDGIAYRSNHDNGEMSVALFDRARDRLVPDNARPMTVDRVRLAALLARYKVGLG